MKLNTEVLAGGVHSSREAGSGHQRILPGRGRRHKANSLALAGPPADSEGQPSAIMKAGFSFQTTRHGPRDALPCVWPRVVAAGLPVAVLGQANYATHYTSTTLAWTWGQPLNNLKRLRMKAVAIILGVLACVSASAQTYEEKVVAAVLMGEAGNQGQRGMSAVAEVIHRRVELTGRTPLQVVTQGQWRHRSFSCMNGWTPAGLVNKFADCPGYSTVALPLAVQLVREPQKLANLTKGATHFTRKEEKPYWAQGHMPVVVIGDHAFYRLKM